MTKQIAGTHYSRMKSQPIDFINANNFLFLEGCVIKYVSRHKVKGKKEDILKAIHCLELIIKRDYVN